MILGDPPVLVNVVSRRYYLAMSTAGPSLLELIERICNLARSGLRTQSDSGQLQPVHLQALAFLGRANRYSNTPQILSEYLGSTKGTVSQSLLLLHRRGLIEREADPHDRRVVRLRLSAEGRRQLATSGLEREWASALADLPREQIDSALQVLAQALTNLQRARGGRSFGVCRTCHQFRREAGDRFRCGLTDEPLSSADTEKICREHEPRG